MKQVKIFGSGCAHCIALKERVYAAIESLGIEVNVEEVSDIVEIMENGILLVPPALMIDGVLKTSGRLPSIIEIQTLLQEG